MGYNIPWPAIVGVSLTAVFGAYAWETKKISDIDRKFNIALAFLSKNIFNIFYSFPNNRCC